MADKWVPSVSTLCIAVSFIQERGSEWLYTQRSGWWVPYSLMWDEWNANDEFYIFPFFFFLARQKNFIDVRIWKLQRLKRQGQPKEKINNLRLPETQALARYQQNPKWAKPKTQIAKSTQICLQQWRRFVTATLERIYVNWAPRASPSSLTPRYYQAYASQAPAGTLCSEPSLSWNSKLRPELEPNFGSSF